MFTQLCIVNSLFTQLFKMHVCWYYLDNKAYFQHQHKYCNLLFMYLCLQTRLLILGSVAGYYVQWTHSLYIHWFSFAFRWKPEDVDDMPSQQTVHCSFGNIRSCCCTERMPGITVFVLRDATWKTFGHRQLECAHVSHFFMLSSDATGESNNIAAVKNMLVYRQRWLAYSMLQLTKLFKILFSFTSSHTE